MARHVVTGIPGKSKKLKTVNTRISDELHAAVIAKSEATGVAYSHVMRRALEDWVVQRVILATPDGKEIQVTVSGTGQDICEPREKWADGDVLHKEECKP
jgi:hypothetical protein